MPVCARQMGIFVAQSKVFAMFLREITGFGRNGILGIVLLFALLPTPVKAAAARSEERVQVAYLDGDLPELRLHELMDLEVSSAAGKEQTVAETAAAIFVITGEDIRRSGATSIPDALRMVPGLNVARITASKWAISSRSFNSSLSNKLLVLVDGRSVFNNLFASTFWDVQDTLLEDIDRIEVIRGPAATIWGANAVNGVINIITRSARLTQGPLVTAGTGTEERAFGALRYGGAVGPDAHWRGYAKYFQRDDSEGIDGWDADDDWDQLRGGFRLDWQPRGGEELTVQGDAYSGSAGTTGTRFDAASAYPRRVEEDTQLSGANLLARWETATVGAGKMSLQAYYDWTHRADTLFGEERHTLDFSLQQTLKPGLRQELFWGVGYRYGLSDLDQSPTIAVSRARRTEHLYSLFLQDEIALLPERLVLTVGARFEHNSYTDGEIHPNLRLLGLLSEHHSLWGAVSRASRTPSRFDREMRILSPVSSAPPVVGILAADPDVASERVTAYEVGYRYHPAAHISFDATIFYNDYDRLRSFELDPIFLEGSPPPTHLVLPGTIDNRLEGRTYGLELAVDCQPASFLQLDLAYTYLEIAVHHRQLGSDIFARLEEEKSPKHQGSLRAGFDLPGQLELDLWLRYVDRLRRDDIPSYLELDTRIGWKPRPDLELALVGQNLLDSHHQEFIRETLFNSIPTEVERAVYVKMTWRP